MCTSTIQKNVAIEVALDYGYMIGYNEARDTAGAMEHALNLNKLQELHDIYVVARDDLQGFLQ